MTRKTVLGLAAFAALVGFGFPASAAPYTLVDRNSTAIIEVGSDSGMKDWSVDGIDQLYKQWFWYRAGTMTREESVDALSLVSASAYDTGGAAGADHLTVHYAGAAPSGQTFTVQIDYSLAGSDPGTGVANMSEQITIRNTSNAPLEMHFFQYSDFDLGGTPGDDVAWFNGLNTVSQIDPTALSPLNFHETVDTPSPNGWEIHTVGNGSDKTPVPGDTLFKLEDGDVDTLNNSASPVTGDVSWAFQWDKILQPAGSNFFGIPTDVLVISKLKQLQVSTFHERTDMPEPGTLALLALGCAGLALLHRRRTTSRRSAAQRS